MIFNSLKESDLVPDIFEWVKTQAVIIKHVIIYLYI